MKEKCNIEGCPHDAKYGLFRTKDGKKDWLHVCSSHEEEIAKENIERSGGYIKKKTYRNQCRSEGR